MVVTVPSVWLMEWEFCFVWLVVNTLILQVSTMGLCSVLLDTVQIIAQFQIMVLVRFGLVWFWLAMVLLSVWPQSLLLCPFHKKLRIWLKEFFDFCQADNQRFSCIMFCYTYWQLTCENLQVSEFSFLLKSTKKRLCLSTPEIFHNNSCLLELWG